MELLMASNKTVYVIIMYKWKTSERFKVYFGEWSFSCHSSFRNLLLSCLNTQWWGQQMCTQVQAIFQWHTFAEVVHENVLRMAGDMRRIALLKCVRERIALQVCGVRQNSMAMDSCVMCMCCIHCTNVLIIVHPCGECKYPHAFSWKHCLLQVVFAYGQMWFWRVVI